MSGLLALFQDGLPAATGGGGGQFAEGDFTSTCPGCGMEHANFNGSDFGPLAFLNADERGGSGPNNKPSLTTTDAGAQITRSGLSWATGLGAPANVTFAFRSTAPATMPTDTTGFQRFNESQIAATLLALQSWSDVANITFTRVSDADGFSNEATMLFSNYTGGQEGAGAFAYQPGNRATTSVTGDVWVNFSGSNITPAILNYGHHTLTHEIGHAIGLSHPAAYNASEGVSITYANDATYYEDSRQYTVMSYFSESNTGGNFRNPTTGGSQYSAVPLLDDIAAAQRLYGANMTTRTGDTVYGFNSNADRAWFSAASASTSLIFAVWDAGGIDTFDFSGYTQNQVIDLRQGAFSNVGGLIGNVAVAVGTVIENARGGLGADRLIGNSADNVLTGHYGNDIIDGGLGSDTAAFLSRRSEYTITVSGQTVTVTHVAEGTDTITNVEFLRFSDMTLSVGPNGDIVTSGGITLSGDLTNDTLNGTAFVDVLSGGGGNDVINGLGGDDTLNGGLGDDQVFGGDGNDILIGGSGVDLLDGGAGTDLANYFGAAAGVNVNLVAGTATGGAGMDTLRGIENVRGTAFADILIGDNGNNVLRGSGGADILYGGAGNDSFYSGLNGVTGGAPDIIKARSTANNTAETAVSLDGGFDLVPRDDVAASATTPHATVVATGSGNPEWYSFMAAAGSAVIIDIDTPVGAAFDSVIRIYGSNRELLATNDDGATTGDMGNRMDSAITFTIPANGVYYVEVTEWVSNDPLVTKGVTAGAAYTMHVSVPGHTVAPSNFIGATMFGEGGDDTFYQTPFGPDDAYDIQNRGEGNDVIDGGDGVDTVVYSGYYGAQNTVTIANGVTTVHAPNISGTDTLTNVEFIRFGQQLIALTADGPVMMGTEGADTINATSGADVIRALGGNDTIYAQAGADLLIGGGGSDTLDGGAGVDTAGYEGIRYQYSRANSSTVSGGPEGGTDALVSIENARFVDGTLTFDPTSGSAQVMRLYAATLNRAPDQGGLEANVAGLATFGLGGLAEIFVNSAEFQARFGALNNQQFVEQMYVFALGRQGDPIGIRDWVNYLNAGATRGQVVIGFSESAEHIARTAPTLNAGLWIPDAQAQTIARLYDATFDRLPDSYGLISWTANLKNGLPLLDIALGFSGSAEFQQRYGSLSNQAFVEQLYRFCLNREGDAVGVAAWTAQLNGGVNRGQVLLAFSESAEHVNLTAASWLGGIQTIDYSRPSAAPKGAEDAATLPGAPDEAVVLVDGGKSHDPLVLPADHDVGRAAETPLTLPIILSEDVLPALKGTPSTLTVLPLDDDFILPAAALQTPLVLASNDFGDTLPDYPFGPALPEPGFNPAGIPEPLPAWSTDPLVWTHLPDAHDDWMLN